MLTKLENLKLNACIRCFGSMTVEEAMVEALWNADMADKMPKNDPAHTRYKNESDSYLNFAVFLEKQAQP